MKINEIKEVLEKLNYNCFLNDQLLTVKLDFSHNVMIDFSNPDKIIMKDKLVSWNFLTGGVVMSLKNAIIYNFVLLLLFGLFCQYLEFLENNYLSLLLIFSTWILIFTSFYLIKMESFKNMMTNLILK